MILRQNGLDNGAVRVTFSLPAMIWAEKVNLVGDFNGWDHDSLPMDLNEETWRITLELDPGNRYHFCYLIDGTRRCSDGMADQYELNEFGEYTSVIQV